MQDLIALPVSGQWYTDTAQEIGMAQIIVPPTSRLIGKTVTQAWFCSTYDLSVIGMKHGTKPVPDSVIDEPLRPGDTLLTVGPWRAIRKLADERRNLVLLDLPAESDEAVPARHRAPLAVGVLALVVVLMVWGIVPIVQAALFRCLPLGLFRCIDRAGAYRSIHWQSLILIVGMLPFSLALQPHRRRRDRGTGAAQSAGRGLSPAGSRGGLRGHRAAGALHLQHGNGRPDGPGGTGRRQRPRRLALFVRHDRRVGRVGCLHDACLLTGEHAGRGTGQLQIRRFPADRRAFRGDLHGGKCGSCAARAAFLATMHRGQKRDGGLRRLSFRRL